MTFKVNENIIITFSHVRTIVVSKLRWVFVTCNSRALIVRTHIQNWWCLIYREWLLQGVPVAPGRSWNRSGLVYVTMNQKITVNHVTSLVDPGNRCYHTSFCNVADGILHVFRPDREVNNWAASRATSWTYMSSLGAPQIMWIGNAWHIRPSWIGASKWGSTSG